MVPQMDEFGLNKAFEDAEGKDGLTFVKWDASKGREYNINNAQDANIGITFPLMGIAETATLVQPMTSGLRPQRWPSADHPRCHPAQEHHQTPHGRHHG